MLTASNNYITTDTKSEWNIYRDLSTTSHSWVVNTSSSPLSSNKSFKSTSHSLNDLTTSTNISSGGGSPNSPATKDSTKGHNSHNLQDTSKNQVVVLRKPMPLTQTRFAFPDLSNNKDNFTTTGKKTENLGKKLTFPSSSSSDMLECQLLNNTHLIEKLKDELIKATSTQRSKNTGVIFNGDNSNPTSVKGFTNDLSPTSGPYTVENVQKLLNDLSSKLPDITRSFNQFTDVSNKQPHEITQEFLKSFKHPISDRADSEYDSKKSIQSNASKPILGQNSLALKNGGEPLNDAKKDGLNKGFSFTELVGSATAPSLITSESQFDSSKLAFLLNEFEQGKLRANKLCPKTTHSDNAVRKSDEKNVEYKASRSVTRNGINSNNSNENKTDNDINNNNIALAQTLLEQLLINANLGKSEQKSVKDSNSPLTPKSAKFSASQINGDESSSIEDKNVSINEKQMSPANGQDETSFISSGTSSLVSDKELCAILHNLSLKSSSFSNWSSLNDSGDLTDDKGNSITATKVPRKYSMGQKPAMYNKNYAVANNSTNNYNCYQPNNHQSKKSAYTNYNIPITYANIRPSNWAPISNNSDTASNTTPGSNNQWNDKMVQDKKLALLNALILSQMRMNDYNTKGQQTTTGRNNSLDRVNEAVQTMSGDDPYIGETMVTIRNRTNNNNNNIVNDGADLENDVFTNVQTFGASNATIAPTNPFYYANEGQALESFNEALEGNVDGMAFFAQNAFDPLLDGNNNGSNFYFDNINHTGTNVRNSSFNNNNVNNISLNNEMMTSNNNNNLSEPTSPYGVEQIAKLYKNAAAISDASFTWSGQLPPRLYKNPIYSPKIFLGGVPWDITEIGLLSAFRPFGNLRVEWPGKETIHPRYPPKGYVYIIFDSDKSVKGLLQACTHDFSNGGDWYYKVSSKRMRCKEVQVIPWVISDTNFIRQPSQRLDPCKTVFVGALHGLLNAEGLACVMNDLFGGVVYAGVDTDKFKYPIGSGRVTFSNHKSYMKAVAAAFVEVKTPKFVKRIQIDPYLEDAFCSICKVRAGNYFCRDMMCFKYFCERCWYYHHEVANKDPNSGCFMTNTHKPLMRNARKEENKLSLMMF